MSAQSAVEVDTGFCCQADINKRRHWLGHETTEWWDGTRNATSILIDFFMIREAHILALDDLLKLASIELFDS